MLSGCISQQPAGKVTLEINPVIDYYPLGGFTERSDGAFIVLNGSIPDVKESLSDIVVKKVIEGEKGLMNLEFNVELI